MMWAWGERCEGLPHQHLLERRGWRLHRRHSRPRGLLGVRDNASRGARRGAAGEGRVARGSARGRKAGSGSTLSCRSARARVLEPREPDCAPPRTPRNADADRFADGPREPRGEQRSGVPRSHRAVASALSRGKRSDDGRGATQTAQYASARPPTFALGPLPSRADRPTWKGCRQILRAEGHAAGPQDDGRCDRAAAPQDDGRASRAGPDPLGVWTLPVPA